MNVVKMRGGIGNQMFQYAFGKVLTYAGKMVCYDTTWYVPHRVEFAEHPRPFRLERFQVTSLHIHPFESKNATVYEKRVGYNPKVFDLVNDNNFDGYWQYYDYYEKILPVLREEFQLQSCHYTEKFMEMAELIWSTESVSVHVRRGDYLKQRAGGYSNLPAKYYFLAIKELKGDLFIFSDDIPWCKSTFVKQYFPNRKITFVDMEDYLCFELMRFCKHHIISNSTYSWWAAVLNAYADKKVIRPKHYLNESEQISDTYRYPQGWIKVEDFVSNSVTR
jgi:hypothetical protein